MGRYFITLRAVVICAIAAAFTPACAYALTPQEVLVVANADIPDSMTLANAYVRLRQIPPQNLLALKTSTAYNISAADYERQIRLPVKKYLQDKGLANTIRCICVMYGVPVRIEPTQLPAEALEVFRAYSNAATRSEYRLAIDIQLISTVGRKFPTPKGRDLHDLAGFFDPLAGNPTTPPADFNKALGNALALLAEKQSQVKELPDPAKREIAYGQLMALYLDIGGVRGLINFIQDAKPPNPPDLQVLQSQLAEMEKQWISLQGEQFNLQMARQELALAERMQGLAQLHALAQNKAMFLAPESTDSALDSELALLWWDNRYNPGGWIPNLLSWRNDGQTATYMLPPTLMTARLDGPSRNDVMRVIKSSIDAENHGLQGRFYIDAGGLQPAYDKHLVQLASFVKERTKFPVVLDTHQVLFAPNSCPEAALYVGWYSLSNYVPCCMWTEGAVGWHISSFEAVHLRDPNSREWCVKMIQNGVVATIGAVREPYLGSFPLPSEFFPLLMTGKWTLAECYWRTAPMASWRLTLIGDPLYTPFLKNPQLDVAALPKGLSPQ